jgi:hypothetical protein
VIRTVKYASVCVTDPGGFAFSGQSVTQPYRAEDTAVCAVLVPRVIHQRVPEWNCSCGFYARTTPAAGPTAWWLLDVELSGKVIEHENGWRAEKQRVLAAYAPAQCAVCAAPASALGCTMVFLAFPRFVFSYCSRHTHAPLEYSAPDLAGMLGTEVHMPEPAPDTGVAVTGTPAASRPGRWSG